MFRAYFSCSSVVQLFIQQGTRRRRIAGCDVDVNARDLKALRPTWVDNRISMKYENCKCTRELQGESLWNWLCPAARGTTKVTELWVAVQHVVTWSKMLDSDSCIH